VPNEAGEGLVRNALGHRISAGIEVSLTASGRKEVAIVRLVAGEVCAHVSSDLCHADIVALNAVLARVEESLSKQHRSRKRSAA
jgi:hypothetical protein